MDAKFSIGVHILILVSEAAVPLSSQEIAGSVGVNASLVRKIAGRLKSGGLISSRQGSRGFSLKKPPEEISLLEISRAVYETDKIQVFNIHRNPNDQCLVGRYIQPVLADTFSRMEAEAARTLEETRLSELIADMRHRANAAPSGSVRD